MNTKVRDWNIIDDDLNRKIKLVHELKSQFDDQFE